MIQMENAGKRAASAFKFGAVTPADSTDTMPWSEAESGPGYCEYLWVQTGGTITLVDARGEATQMTVADKSYIFAAAVRVKATGTAATGIIGYWN